MSDLARIARELATLAAKEAGPEEINTIVVLNFIPPGGERSPPPPAQGDEVVVHITPHRYHRPVTYSRKPGAAGGSALWGSSSNV